MPLQNSIAENEQKLIVKLCRMIPRLIKCDAYHSEIKTTNFIQGVKGII